MLDSHVMRAWHPLRFGHKLRLSVEQTHPRSTAVEFDIYSELTSGPTCSMADHWKTSTCPFRDSCRNAQIDFRW